MSVYSDTVLLVHIPKTGGTSAREWMMDHLKGAVINSLEEGPLPIDSTPLRHITEYTGRPLDSWEKIVIPVRSPYEQVVSHWNYHWHRYALGGRHVHDTTAALCKTLTHWLLEPNSDFRLWYEMKIRGQSFNDARRYLSRVGFYEYYAATEDGEVPDNVQFIECSTMTTDFPAALARFCETTGPFPHKRSSPHKPNPFQYHTPHSMNIVHRRFAWAFENFYEMQREAA